MGVLVMVLVALAVCAIFLTMAPGQRLVTRLGLRRFQKGAAPAEDRDFLLDACGGDRAAVEARLEAVRMRYPDWDEAQLYRRAIRAVMNERRTSGASDAFGHGGDGGSPEAGPPRDPPGS